MIERRAFIRTVGLGVLAAPLTAEAQPASKMPRIAVLWGGNAAFAESYVEAGRKAMADLGYVEGRNFITEARFAERKPGAIDALAADLVRLRVDAIVAAGDPAIRAAQRATTTIPIVMVAAGDPVRAGFATSLARPGGNLTGMTFLSRELSAKRLEILKEAVPGVSRVAVLWNPDNAGGQINFDATQAAAKSLGLMLQSAEVRAVSELERAFGAMADKNVQAVVVLTDPVTSNLAGRVVADLAAKHRLPTVCELREFTSEGGLVSYGPSLRLMAQRTAVYIDRILKGARPADLPIEQPTKFELAVNLKTAKTLGLTIPQSLLLRADEVIE
jgi:putative ABC transport system substrate-binding protein